MNSGKVLVIAAAMLLAALGRHEANAQPAPVTPPAIATQPAPAPAQPAGMPDQAYILGPEDVVQVEVLGRTDFTTRTKIGADGKIQLPLLGAIPAADRTVLQFRDQVRDALQKGGFFNRPIVDVQVASYASRYVTVLGAVGTLQPFTGPDAVRYASGLLRQQHIREAVTRRVERLVADGKKAVVINKDFGPSPTRPAAARRAL